MNARKAIEEGRFTEYKTEFIKRYNAQQFS